MIKKIIWKAHRIVQKHCW